MVGVTGRLRCEERELAATNGFVSVTAGPAIIAVVSSRGARDFSFRLPPGEYRLSLSAEDCERVTREIGVPAGQAMLDLEAIELEATVLSLLYGEPFPGWKVTDARGVEPTVALEDYRGKWVLLEFWGYW
ncbi:MAG: hypothetical protein ISR76_06295 [Planctomycetes bacterium]|nr:hypothetical protein [Planctomycetota bacterium]MBL7008590.1 hypothetical protein [Planctomycetota bacterium]